MSHVFEKTVDDLLGAVSDDIGDEYFNNRKFTFRPETARMRSELGEVDNDGLAEFTTNEFGGEVEVQRQTLMEATLGVLLERQATWGPMFNHPRTIVIGPDASFQCDVNRFGVLKNEWKEQPELQVDNGNTVFPKDVDQIVWVNLCPRDYSGLLNPSAAWSLVEIGVARFHHEEREGNTGPISVGGARFYSGMGEGKQFYERMEKRAELKELTEILFGEGEERDMDEDILEAEYEYYGEGAGDVISHVQAAAVVLERLLRDRTSGLEDLLTYKKESKKVRHQTDRVYRAVISGQMPYARADLSEDTRQPAVMPGKFSIERIVDVLEHVVVGATGKRRTRRTGEPLPVMDDDTLSPLSGSDVETFL